MRESGSLNPPKGDLAEALKRLRPAPPRASLHEVWYVAGVEAGRRRAVAWRAVAAVALAAGIALAIVRRPTPVAVERIVYLPKETTSIVAVAPQERMAVEPSSSATYVHLRDALVQYGLSGLPASLPATGDGRPAPRHAFPGPDGIDAFSPGGWYPMSERG